MGVELARALLDSSINVKELVLCDVVEPRPLFGFENDSRVVRIKSDLTDHKEIDKLLGTREYTGIALFHGLMSGGSEENFELGEPLSHTRPTFAKQPLGMAINLEATRYMLEVIRNRKYAKAPVVLYTSSGAVYGGEIKDGTVTDDTVPMPQGSYGTQKLVGQPHVIAYCALKASARSANTSALTILDVDGSMHA